MIKKLMPWVMSRFNVGKLDDFISKAPIFKYAYRFFFQKTIEYDFPRHLFIEPTSACNFRCKMCPRTNNDTLVGNMDFEIFKKIIDESKNYGPISFSLHLFGEPFLAPKIIEMIEYIKKSDPNNTILITTNGALLNEEKARDIVKYKVDKITFSFTSPDKNTYQEKAGVDKLEEVEKNIEKLVNIKKEARSRKPLIFARMIVAEDTKSQASDFVEKWKNTGVVSEVRKIHNFGGNIKGSLREKQRKRYPCYHLWLAPGIHWNGDFSICCDDPQRKTLLGNVKQSSVHEIWTGEKLKQYRRFHLEGRYDLVPVCKDCDVWTMYSDLFFEYQKNKSSR
ncbi:MAG: radical SAM protein [bacterium]